MREKLAIAKSLRVSRQSFSDKDSRKLCSKFYRAYVFECILKRKDNFKVSFGEKYIQSFFKRSADWFEYIRDNIYRFFLIHFTPNNDKSFKNYELIHFGVSKPIHLKFSGTPNEISLYKFLADTGLRITDEDIPFSGPTVYYVALS